MRAKLAKLSVDTRPPASVRSSTKARTQLRAASLMSCSSVTSSNTPCTSHADKGQLRCSTQEPDRILSLLNMSSENLMCICSICNCIMLSEKSAGSMRVV